MPMSTTASTASCLVRRVIGCRSGSRSRGRAPTAAIPSLLPSASEMFSITTNSGARLDGVNEAAHVAVAAGQLDVHFELGQRAAPLLDRLVPASLVLRGVTAARAAARVRRSGGARPTDPAPAPSNRTSRSSFVARSLPVSVPLAFPNSACAAVTRLFCCQRALLDVGHAPCQRAHDEHVEQDVQDQSAARSGRPRACAPERRGGPASCRVRCQSPAAPWRAVVAATGFSPAAGLACCTYERLR